MGKIKLLKEIAKPAKQASSSIKVNEAAVLNGEVKRLIDVCDKLNSVVGEVNSRLVEQKQKMIIFEERLDHQAKAIGECVSNDKLEYELKGKANEGSYTNAKEFESFKRKQEARVNVDAFLFGVGTVVAVSSIGAWALLAGVLVGGTYLVCHNMA